LPDKEVKKAKEGHKTDFPDGIPECGADALRFGLLAYTVQGRDINLDIKRVVGYRQFCNKMWNAVRFCLGVVKDFVPKASVEADLASAPGLAPRDKWILARLQATIAAADDMMGKYEFGRLINDVLYPFWLGDLCGVYLELVKPVVYDMSPENADARRAAQATLWVCLDNGIRLLHPFMPFVTEELWQRLPGRGTLGDTASIMMAPYPEGQAAWANAATVEAMEGFVKPAIDATRSLKSGYGLTFKQSPDCYLVASNADVAAKLAPQLADLKTLCVLGDVKVVADADVPSGCAMAIVSKDLKVYLAIAGLVDAKAEVAKLEKQIAKHDKAIATLESEMARPGFANAKQEIKDGKVEKMDGFKAQVASARAAIADFEKFAKA
jgi:valyl-tRNA synthetase